MNYGYQPNFYPQRNGRIWVQGEAGAKSYLVAPNSMVDLWDSEKQTIYVKSADISGVPSMTIIDYTVRDNEPKQGFATQSELKELKAYVDEKLKEAGGTVEEQLSFDV